MSWLPRFADRRLRSELEAQKATNLKLHKACKFHRDRANALAVSKKTTKTRLTSERRQHRLVRQACPSCEDLRFASWQLSQGQSADVAEWLLERAIDVEAAGVSDYEPAQS